MNKVKHNKCIEKLHVKLLQIAQVCQISVEIFSVYKNSTIFLTLLFLESDMLINKYYLKHFGVICAKHILRLEIIV